MITSKRHLFTPIAPALFLLAGFFFCGRALAAEPLNKVMDAAATIQGPAFDADVKAAQIQAQAVSRAATKIASSTQPDYGRDLLQSEGFNKEVQQQKRQNATSMNDITPGFVAKVQNMLPKSGHFLGSPKYGEHFVVSPNGEVIITLIRSLATSPPAAQQPLLLKLQAFSESGAPEAMNFMGVILEHGLFGARADMQRAIAFYRSAAAARYQPAAYNLALAAAYGRDAGTSANQAINLITKAAALGEESSYRVCGLGSFLGFRRNDQSAAIKFSKNCLSPLANLSKASFNAGLTTPERVKLLRDSLSTGADDAYAVIERVTRADAATDKNFTFCKYTLINRYRQSTQFDGLSKAASHCYSQFAQDTGNNFRNKQMHDQVVAGITGFVPAEISALKQIRQSNHFHYSWSVPYLPFPQPDVDLFEPLLSRAKP